MTTNKTVTWTSSNTTVATVSSGGVVTAKAAGNAIITATTSDGSKKAECTVAVGMKFTELYPFTLPAYDEDASYRITFTGGTPPYRIIMRAYKEGVGGCIHEEIIENTTDTSVRYSVFGDAKYKESGTYYAAVTVYDSKGTYIYKESRHTAGTAGMSITEVKRTPTNEKDALYHISFTGGTAPYTVVLRTYQLGVGGCIHEKTINSTSATSIDYAVFGDAKFITSGTYLAAVNVYDSEGRHVYKESAQESVTVESSGGSSAVVINQNNYNSTTEDVYYYCGISGCSSGGVHTIMDSGCGLCAIVNAVRYLTGNAIDVHDVAKYSRENNLHDPHNGIYHSIFQKYANDYGPSYGFKYITQAYDLETVKTYIQNGDVAIVSAAHQNNTGGHIMVIAAYDASTNQYLFLDSDGFGSWVVAGSSAWKSVTITSDGMELVDNCSGSKGVRLKNYYIYGKSAISSGTHTNQYNPKPFTKMVANIRTCPSIASAKRDACTTIAEWLLSEAFEPAFVAGVCANVNAQT